MEEQYGNLIWDGFGSKTLIAFESDVAFYVMEQFGDYNMAMAFACIVLGAFLGMSVNFGFGRAMSRLQFTGVELMPQERYDRWNGRFSTLIPYLAVFMPWMDPLFSWTKFLIPGLYMMGVFVFFAGLFRAPVALTLITLLAGQAMFYGAHFMS